MKGAEGDPERVIGAYVTDVASSGRMQLAAGRQSDRRGRPGTQSEAVCRNTRPRRAPDMFRPTGAAGDSAACHRRCHLCDDGGEPATCSTLATRHGAAILVRFAPRSTTSCSASYLQRRGCLRLRHEHRHRRVRRMARIVGDATVPLTIDSARPGRRHVQARRRSSQSEGTPYDYHWLLYTFRVKSRKDIGIYRPRHEWQFSEPCGPIARDERTRDRTPGAGALTKTVACCGQVQAGERIVSPTVSSTCCIPATCGISGARAERRADRRLNADESGSTQQRPGAPDQAWRTSAPRCWRRSNLGRRRRVSMKTRRRKSFARSSRTSWSRARTGRRPASSAATPLKLAAGAWSSDPDRRGCSTTSIVERISMHADHPCEVHCDPKRRNRGSTSRHPSRVAYVQAQLLLKTAAASARFAEAAGRSGLTTRRGALCSGRGGTWPLSVFLSYPTDADLETFMPDTGFSGRAGGVGGHGR